MICRQYLYLFENNNTTFTQKLLLVQFLIKSGRSPCIEHHINVNGRRFCEALLFIEQELTIVYDLGL